MGWTQDQRVEDRSQGLSYGAASVFAGLGAHRYGDPEAANKLAQVVMENSRHEIFALASDDNAAMFTEIADQLDDLLQPMFKKARQKDRDEIARLNADIAKYKASGSGGPDLSDKTPKGGGGPLTEEEAKTLSITELTERRAAERAR